MAEAAAAAPAAAEGAAGAAPAAAAATPAAADAVPAAEEIPAAVAAARASVHVTNRIAKQLKAAEIKKAKRRPPGKAYYAPVQPPSADLLHSMNQSKLRRDPHTRKRTAASGYRSNLNRIEHVITSSDGAAPPEVPSCPPTPEDDEEASTDGDSLSAAADFEGKVEGPALSPPALPNATSPSTVTPDTVPRDDEHNHSIVKPPSLLPEGDDEGGDGDDGGDPRLDPPHSPEAALRGRVKQLGSVIQSTRAMIEDIQRETTDSEELSVYASIQRVRTQGVASTLDTQQLAPRTKLPPRTQSVQRGSGLPHADEMMLRALVRELLRKTREGRRREEGLRSAKGALECKFQRYRGLIERYRDLEKGQDLVDYERMKAENRFFRRERVMLYNRLYGHLGSVRLPPVKPLYCDTEEDVQDLMVQLQHEHEQLNARVNAERDALRQSARGDRENARVAVQRLKRLRRGIQMRKNCTQALERQLMSLQDPQMQSPPRAPIKAGSPLSPYPSDLGWDADAPAAPDPRDEKIAELKSKVAALRTLTDQLKYKVLTLEAANDDITDTAERERQEWDKCREWLESALQRQQDENAQLSKEKNELSRRLFAQPPSTAAIEKAEMRHNDDGRDILAAQTMKHSGVPQSSELHSILYALTDTIMGGVCDLMRACMKSASKLSFHLRGEHQASLDALAQNAEKAVAEFPRKVSTSMAVLNTQFQEQIAAAVAKALASSPKRQKSGLVTRMPQIPSALRGRKKKGDRDSDEESEAGQTAVPVARRPSRAGGIGLRRASSIHRSKSPQAPGSPPNTGLRKGRGSFMADSGKPFPRLSFSSNPQPRPGRSPSIRFGSFAGTPQKGAPALGHGLLMAQQLDLECTAEPDPNIILLEKRLADAMAQLKAAKPAPASTLASPDTGALPVARRRSSISPSVSPGNPPLAAKRRKSAVSSPPPHPDDQVSLCLTGLDRAALLEAVDGMRAARGAQQAAPPAPAPAADSPEASERSAAPAPPPGEIDAMIQELEEVLANAETDAAQIRMSLTARDLLAEAVEQRRLLLQQQQERRASRAPVRHVGCQVEDLVVRSILSQAIATTSSPAYSRTAGDTPAKGVEGRSPRASRGDAAWRGASPSSDGDPAGSSPGSPRERRRSSARVVVLPPGTDGTPAPLDPAALATYDSAHGASGSAGDTPSPRTAMQLHRIYHVAQQDIISRDVRHEVARTLADAVAAAASRMGRKRESAAVVVNHSGPVAARVAALPSPPEAPVRQSPRRGRAKTGVSKFENFEAFLFEGVSQAFGEAAVRRASALPPRQQSEGPTAQLAASVSSSPAQQAESPEVRSEDVTTPQALTTPQQQEDESVREIRVLKPPEELVEETDKGRITRKLLKSWWQECWRRCELALMEVEHERACVMEAVRRRRREQGLLSPAAGSTFSPLGAPAFPAGSPRTPCQGVQRPRISVVKARPSSAAASEKRSSVPSQSPAPTPPTVTLPSHLQPPEEGLAVLRQAFERVAQQQGEEGVTRGATAAALHADPDVYAMLDPRKPSALRDGLLRWLPAAHGDERALSWAELEGEVLDTGERDAKAPRTVPVGPAEPVEEVPDLRPAPLELSLDEPGEDTVIDNRALDEWVGQLVPMQEVEKMIEKVKETAVAPAREQEHKEEVARLRGEIEEARAEKDRIREQALLREEMLQERSHEAEQDAIRQKKEAHRVQDMLSLMRASHEQRRKDLESTRDKLRLSEEALAVRTGELQRTKEALAETEADLLKVRNDLLQNRLQWADHMQKMGVAVSVANAERDRAIAKCEQQVAAAQRLCKRQVEDEMIKTQQVQEKLLRMKRLKEEQEALANAEAQRKLDLLSKELERDKRRAVHEIKVNAERERHHHQKELLRADLDVRDALSLAKEGEEKLVGKNRLVDNLRDQLQQARVAIANACKEMDAREAAAEERMRDAAREMDLERERWRVERLRLESKVGEATKAAEDACSIQEQAIAEAAAKQAAYGELSAQFHRARQQHQDELTRLDGELRKGKVAKRMLDSVSRQGTLTQLEGLRKDVARLTSELETVTKERDELKQRGGAEQREQQFWQRRDKLAAAHVLVLHRPLFQLLEALRDVFRLSVVVDEPRDVLWAERFFGLSSESPRSGPASARSNSAARLEPGAPPPTVETQQVQLQRALAAAADCARSDEQAVRQLLASVEELRRNQTRRQRLLSRPATALETRVNEQAARWEQRQQGLLSERQSKLATIARLNPEGDEHPPPPRASSAQPPPRSPVRREGPIVAAPLCLVGGSMSGFRPASAAGSAVTAPVQQRRGGGAGSPRPSPPRSPSPQPSPRTPARTRAPVYVLAADSPSFVSECKAHWTETGEPPPLLAPMSRAYRQGGLPPPTQSIRPPTAAAAQGARQHPRQWQHKDLPHPVLQLPARQESPPRRASAAPQRSRTPAAAPPPLLPPTKAPLRPGSAPPLPLGVSGAQPPGSPSVSSQGSSHRSSPRLCNAQGDVVSGCQTSPRPAADAGVHYAPQPEPLTSPRRGRSPRGADPLRGKRTAAAPARRAAASSAESPLALGALSVGGAPRAASAAPRRAPPHRAAGGPVARKFPGRR